MLMMAFGLMSFSATPCLSIDNTATMGSYSDSFPSLRIWKSSNAYDDKGDMLSGVKFWGAVAARVAAGQGYQHPNGRLWFDSLKDVASTAGRTLLTEAYSDFMFYTECGNSKVDYGASFNYGNAQTHNFWFVADSMGLTWTDLFFILADDSDSTSYPLRTASCVGTADPGRKWANVDLNDSQKYQSQFGTYNNPDDNNYPGTDSYYMNYADDTMNYALMKALAYKRLKENGDIFKNYDSTMDGFTFDNSHPDSWRSPNYVHTTGEYEWWSFGGNTGGASWVWGASAIDWVGYDAPFVIGGPNYTTLSNAWHASFNIMLDTMKEMGISTSCNYVNGSPSAIGEYAARHGEAVTTLFFEYKGNDVLTKPYATITAVSGANAELSRVDSAILHGIPHVNECRMYLGYADDTGHAWAAHTYLCAHLTYQDTALTYFCFQNRSNGSAADGDTMYLMNWELFRLNYGNVLNERQYVDTGTTVEGDAVHLFWREYDSAFVFWFSSDAMRAGDSARANYYEWDCGEPVYELGRLTPGHCDSTYRADGIIQIPPRWGVVAWKLGSEAPPSISNILPTSAFKDSTDNVSALIQDDYGINHAYSYLWNPSDDSIYIGDMTYDPVDPSEVYSNPYTWLDSGLYWIVFVADDDSGNTTKDSIQILVDVAHTYPVISNIQPTFGYKDSTDNITADITDDNGVQYTYCWIIDPDSDSNHVGGDTLSPVDTDTTMTYSYQWADSGNHYIIWKAIDEGPATTIETLLVTISVQGVAVDAIDFNVSTGMIDTHGRSAGYEDINYGNNTALRNSDFYYHAIIGDYSMDDSISAAHTIDSAWLTWRSEGMANYGANDTTLLYLVMVTDDKDWRELEMTWNNWDDLNLWTTPGGDYIGCISDTIILTSTSHPAGTYDKFTIHINTDFGGMWMDSVKYPTGNFGFMIKSQPTGTSTGNEIILMGSTEHGTEAYQPWIRVFLHSAALAAAPDAGTIWQGRNTEGIDIQ